MYNGNKAVEGWAVIPKRCPALVDRNGDPVASDNERRAQRGLEALVHYRRQHETLGESVEECAGDLISDLLHALDLSEESSDDVIERGWGQYRTEVQLDGGPVRREPIRCQECTWPMLDAEPGVVCGFCGGAPTRKAPTKRGRRRERLVVRVARRTVVYGGLVAVGAVGWLVLHGR
jgi:hypothetical protein